jgi:lantibiotic biosynthesis protein
MKLIEKKIDEIYELLKERKGFSKNIGVLTGDSGIALFLFYYSQKQKNNTASDLAYSHIEECFKKINNNYQTPTYCSGIVGFFWCLEKLNENNFIHSDNDKLLAEFDDFFFNQMIHDIKNNNYDFLHGGLGYAFYFLKRYNNTKSIDLKNKYKKNLMTVVDEIEKVSIKNNNEIMWSSSIKSTDNKIVYNLSLSHGMSSIINFLSRFPNLKENKKQIDKLLNGSINFVLKFYNDKSNESCFPDFIPVIKKNADIKYNSRLAWCYGDLGIALSLYKAGSYLKNPEIIKKSIEIFEKTSYRRLYESHVKDAGVCHGAFGIALIYKKIYSETNNIKFKESYKFWINEGLKMDFHKDGYAGYKKWVGGKGIWENEASILEGISGIGMTLLELEGNNNWDECLLIN